MTHRLTYNSVNIDGLTLLPPGPRPQYTHIAKTNRASSGKVETISQYGLINIEFEAYFSITTYHALTAFFSWARQGKVCSFALDSADISNTTLDGAAAAAQKTIPLTATTSLTAGDYCLIKSIDDDEYEVVEIDSVSAGVSVTAVSNLIYTYASGDIFRHLDYYPSLIYTGGKFDPVRTGTTDTSSDFYYRFSFAFEESP